MDIDSEKIIDKKSIRIMVVDNDPDLCGFVRDALAVEGYQIEILTDSKNALSLAKRFRPHMAILDLVMPDVDGLEVLKQIKKSDPDIIVMIFTGHPSVETAVQSMKLEAFDYIKKPIEVGKLRTIVERAAREKGLLIDPVDDLVKRLGTEIRSARKNAKLTLKDISKRTGLSVSLISQIERAETTASISSLYKIASVLDLHLTIYP